MVVAILVDVVIREPVDPLIPSVRAHVRTVAPQGLDAEGRVVAADVRAQHRLAIAGQGPGDAETGRPGVEFVNIVALGGAEEGGIAGV